MGTPERKSDVRIYVDFQIEYHTRILVQLNLPAATEDIMRDTVFEMIGATNKNKLVSFADEVDRKSRLRRPVTAREKLLKKYEDAKKEEEKKPDEERLSERKILNDLKPDLILELANVRLAESPHQAYLASACRKIMMYMNRTAFSGAEVATRQQPNPYL